jgi:hypothetical protein
MGATTVEVPSSHVAMASHPQEVTELIEKAAAAVFDAALSGGGRQATTGS